MTPMELLELLGEKHSDKVKIEEEQQRIGRIYEHARYGTEECTQEELEEWKKLMDGR